MNNISIKGVCECADLDRKVNLGNGSIVIQKRKRPSNRSIFGCFI